MKARILKFEMIEAASAAALITAVRAFLDAAGEAELVDQESGVDGATFWASIWYT